MLSQTNFNSIPLSRTTELRFEVNQYKGKSYINIRQYVTSDKYAGYTRKGVTLSNELAEQLLVAIRSAGSIQQSSAEQELCRLPKNNSTELIARIIPPSEKNQIGSLDVRECIRSEKYTGWTQKGFRLLLNNLPLVIAYLEGCLSQLIQTKSNIDSMRAD
ncbi:MAG: transcriptional coactivator p15/PC4 family protein [candidate division KSB1 bacterium]|nr:transcriptional coactivator p15/PC4 family protein [candidate division KSB1 bacterium]MDZ7333704.1 transcriptional coactivator p15/PC4 family protein [candidate division KSB1 bacterium]MDZ7356152.1 transcriptional coactivator p15/PC4 family protein [candidate division KSB1 bacterium]MDZ7375146.1 transcriptional coactivator p15/PC4 family protein [candidate division KSB1 bacterium]MDZ7398870.1 transcriptional coactivator p15/PC4 family protein [candidate division KSB1 bacterium]